MEAYNRDTGVTTFAILNVSYKQKTKSIKMMTADDFFKKFESIKPNPQKVTNYGSSLDEANSWSSLEPIKTNRNLKFLVEDLKERLSTSIRVGNFEIYNAKNYSFDNSFEEDGFYPFAFYGQDHLFIKLKTGRVEARDLVLTKFYDVAKNEQAFLEAFLVFAKHYAYALEHFVPNSDNYLSTTIAQRREILIEVLKIVGGKKYRPFWVQVFQAWTDEELKEMDT